MAAELRSEFPGVSIQLVPSSGGVFDVTADGVLAFSKKRVGRHAEPGEVAAALRAAR